jgi:hypothetical protein
MALNTNKKPETHPGRFSHQIQEVERSRNS